jgi:hypothetical protein
VEHLINKINHPPEQEVDIAYYEIVNSFETRLTQTTEWQKDGDYFRKFTLYDDNYVPVPSLGGTTLIQPL